MDLLRGTGTLSCGHTGSLTAPPLFPYPLPSLMSKCLHLLFRIRGRWRLKFFSGNKEQGTQKGFHGLELWGHRDLLHFNLSVLDGFSTCFSTTVPGTISRYPPPIFPVPWRFPLWRPLLQQSHLPLNLTNPSHGHRSDCVILSNCKVTIISGSNIWAENATVRPDRAA